MSNLLIHQKVDDSDITRKVYQNLGNPEVIKWVPPGRLTVLDIGCGAGDNARLLQQQSNIVDGITLSEVEARLAQAYMRYVWISDIEQGLPFPEDEAVYDCVLCSHVIEHLVEPKPLLAGIRRCLKPGGLLIVALPNLLYYKYRIRLLMGRFDYEDSGIMDNTHVRWYTYSSGQQLLEQAGFHQVRAYVDGYFPFSKFRWYVPEPIRIQMDHWACAAYPGLFGYQLIYVYANPVHA